MKAQFEWTTAKVWAVALVAIFAIIAITLMTLNLQATTYPYTVRFEMDDNTLEAVKSINWTEVREAQEAPQMDSRTAKMTYYGAVIE